MRRQHLIITLLVLAIAGLTAYGVKHYYDTSKEKVISIPIGFQGEARFNSFLASQRLAEKLNYRVKSTKYLPADSYIAQSTLLIPLESLPAKKDNLQQLKQWIRAGGNLICGSIQEYNEKEQFFLAQPVKDFLNINSATPAHNNDTAYSALRLDDKEFHTEIPLSANFDVRSYNNIHRDKSGDFLYAHRPIGDGSITLLRSLHLFNNDNLQEADHAEFLAHLLARGYEQSLLIIQRRDSLSAWSWLSKNAMPVICLLLALALAWILEGSRRFGPRLPNISYGSRKIIEHIDAMANYLWSGGHQSHMLKRLRLRIKERIKKVYPTWHDLSDQQLALELSRISNQETASVAAAMSPINCATRPEEFLETILTLKKIRESI